MRVAHIASEVAPWSQSGGLADVVGALPGAIAAGDPDIDTAVFAPLYRGVRERAAALGARIDDAGEAPVTLGADHIDARFVRVDAAGRATAFLLDAPSLFDRDGLYVDPWHNEYGDNALRFAALCRAAVDHAGRLMGGAPEVIHAHDWQAGLALLWARDQPPHGGGPACVLTIHNMSHQGNFPNHWMPALGLPWDWFHMELLEFWDQVSFLKAGIACADAITTVSPTYAQEIQTPEGGHGMDGFLRAHADRLSGIVNGIDAEAWNPATDPALPATFDADHLAGKRACRDALCAELGLQPAGGPLFGVVSRLADQKGMDLVCDVLPALVEQGGCAAIVGTGLPWLEDRFRAAAADHPGRVAVHIGFDVPRSRRVYAGSDAILVPSRFEPCGLTQLYAMRYGAIPVVRATGGLSDTVDDPGDEALARGEGTGIRFTHPTADELRHAVARTASLFADAGAWARVQRAGMARDSSWSGPAGEYAALYRSLVRPSNVAAGV